MGGGGRFCCSEQVNRYRRRWWCHSCWSLVSFLQFGGKNLTLCWPGSVQGSCCTDLSYGANGPEGDYGIINGSIKNDPLADKTRTIYRFNGSSTDCSKGESVDQTFKAAEINRSKMTFFLSLQKNYVIKKTRSSPAPPCNDLLVTPVSFWSCLLPCLTVDASLTLLPVVTALSCGAKPSNHLSPTCPGFLMDASLQRPLVTPALTAPTC